MTFWETPKPRTRRRVSIANTSNCTVGKYLPGAVREIRLDAGRGQPVDHVSGVGNVRLLVP